MTTPIGKTAAICFFSGRCFGGFSYSFSKILIFQRRSIVGVAFSTTTFALPIIIPSTPNFHGRRRLRLLVTFLAQQHFTPRGSTAFTRPPERRALSDTWERYVGSPLAASGCPGRWRGWSDRLCSDLGLFTRYIGHQCELAWLGLFAR